MNDFVLWVYHITRHSAVPKTCDNINACSFAFAKRMISLWLFYLFIKPMLLVLFVIFGDKLGRKNVLVNIHTAHIVSECAISHNLYS